MVYMHIKLKKKKNLLKYNIMIVGLQKTIIVTLKALTVIKSAHLKNFQIYYV